MTERKESVENQLSNNVSMMFEVYLFPDSTAVHFLSCLTYSVYNQLQSISSNDWIVNHYEDLDPMNILCSPTALNPVLLHCISYMGKWPTVKLGFLGEQCARTLLLFRNVQTKNASFFLFLFLKYYRVHRGSPTLSEFSSFRTNENFPELCCHSLSPFIKSA